MKKKLHLLALIAFVSMLGFAACSESLETEPQLQQETGDIYDPHSTDPEEEDSVRGPG